ncbi:MAG: 16S rRNA pseudouridine(516) synthase [Bacilli bacterium]|jgi:16S rRNA pseudouridine516 synthase|nr:16S rRNA pseudouridine(516) synthase [Bacilli bacterium]MDD3348792.1 16S rRNA pseudouridine(516) synthase [Bacilli bacterium]MDD4056187.1 16S rRNA pseudouridine(516) synthase [Bacilli bacterium]MDY0208803.1 16S rRNA pseudouridine(516) synthase [Bacilli bacterium]
MRLDKYVALVLGVTRNQARQLIKMKEITVEFKSFPRNDDTIDEVRDVVYYKGRKLEYLKNVYIMLNKPKGYLSATIDKKDPTVLDLVLEYQKYNLAMVGRLDKDTEGLFILTSDGALAHRLTSPNKNVFKKYYVEVEGVWNREDILKFNEGLEIEDGNNKRFLTKPAILEMVASNKAYISISEGKYHQIKKMCLKVGKKVTYLKRVAIGELQLDANLSAGEYRLLTDEEIEILKANK